MKSGKYSSRKWLAFVAVMALEFGAAITGIVKFVVAAEGQGGTIASSTGKEVEPGATAPPG